MSTEVKIFKGYYQIRIPVEEANSDKSIRRFLDFLRVKEIASKSQATEEQIKELADDVTKSFWQKNKEKLLNEDRS